MVRLSNSYPLDFVISVEKCRANILQIFPKGAAKLFAAYSIFPCLSLGIKDPDGRAFLMSTLSSALYQHRDVLGNSDILFYSIYDLEQYASKATSVLRSALKEPARTSAMARDAVAYNRQMYVGGASQGKGKYQLHVFS